MKSLNREKKIKDILPIEKGGKSEIKQKEDLDDFVEEPLLEICRKLYDLNIQTVMSSANQKDIGQSADIVIIYDTLSQENKERLEMLSRNFPEKFSISENFRGQGKSVVDVRMPITNPDTTAGEISDYFFSALQSLQIQDIVYDCFLKTELKAKVAKLFQCKEENLTEQDLQDGLEYMRYEIEQDGKYYTKEAFRRHQVYVNSKSQEDKLSENQK